MNTVLAAGPDETPLMDFLIPIAVVLLAVAVVAVVLARRGKARQAARTAQLYGPRSTYQPTFDVPESPEADARDAVERMARDLGELLKSSGAENVTVETNISVTGTSTTGPWSHTTRVEGGSPSAGASQPASGTKFTERSLSLTEADL